jgi:hypothetical protein
MTKIVHGQRKYRNGKGRIRIVTEKQRNKIENQEKIRRIKVCEKKINVGDRESKTVTEK